MRILQVSINFAPEIISTGLYASGVADWLSKRKHDIRTISAVPYYPAWRVFEGYSNLRYVSETTVSGVRVTHCPLYVPQSPSGAKRIIHHISFALTALPVAIYQAARHRPDLVMVVAPSLLSAPVGWLAAKLCGARTWLHIQDFEVEAAFATGLLPETGWIASLARKFESWCLRRFDVVSSISAPMLQKLQDKRVPPDRISEFRNWADIASVIPYDSPPALKEELGIKTAFVALYSGNIANKQGLEIIPQTALVLQHRTDLTFVICGDGPALIKLKQQSEGLNNIVFLPLQPKERLGELLGVADIHLLPQIAGAADLVLPSKLTNMLASGRPVIATADHGTALAAEVEGAGVVIPPEDSERLAEALERLLDNPSERLELGKAARKRALERWDGERILSRLEKRLLDLVDAQPGHDAVLEEQK